MKINKDEKFIFNWKYNKIQIDKDRFKMDDGEPEDEGVAPPEPEVLMEDIIEYLKLLSYERQFWADKGLKPLSKWYFSVKSNPSEQFMYFVTLVSWLLTLCGQSTGGWNQHDDPNNVTNNIVLDLNKLDVKIDYPPSKLKAGSGEAVCQALHGLVQVALRAQKFKFKTPVHLSK